MLKRKLAANLLAAGPSLTTPLEGSASSIVKKRRNLRSVGTAQSIENDVDSLWVRFFNLELILNTKLQTLKVPTAITHIYNPVEYAAELHKAYLRRFIDGPKKVLFVGMNPGPNGMGQTGVPFGNIKTVRDEMHIRGGVQQPDKINKKRPVLGLECAIEEPSGVRLWTLFKKLANGSLDTFGKQCYVHNFCPLIFYDQEGRNKTPSELKDDYKLQIRDICLETLDEEIELLKPEVIVAIGEYVNTTLKRSKYAKTLRILKLPHPSPRAMNNQNWPEKAEKLLNDWNLIKYMRNED